MKTALMVLLVLGFASIDVAEAKSKTKSRKATQAKVAGAKKVSKPHVQIGGEGEPIYVPPPKNVGCTEKILQNGRATLAQRVKDGETKRGLREVERNVSVNCNQLPSKYVREELNREYFQTVADLASVKFETGDAKGCLKLVEPLTRPDSESNYMNLGFEDTEPSVAALEKIEGQCLQATGRSMSQANTSRRPAMFEASNVD